MSATSSTSTVDTASTVTSGGSSVAPSMPATGGAVESAVVLNTIETLAQRFRPSGVCTILLRADGTIAHADSTAATFFHRYVLPQLRYADASCAQLIQKRIQSIDAASNVTVWDCLPGVALVAFACIEKRQVVGVVAVAAKSESFYAGEDVVRVCSKLGIDATWLCQQANQLPSYGEEAIVRQARLMQSMVRDQLRLTSMEGELMSLSSQLSNTYEELSLIYQLSSGMKVNRSAGDFFKQACLDVMDVMNVRGMGVALHDEHFASCKPVLYGETSLPPGSVARLAKQLMKNLQERKCPLLIHDLSSDADFGWLGDHAKQLLAVPLMRQDQVLGCLFGFDKVEKEFDSVDSKLLNSIANESGIYLENSMLFEDVHGLMMGLLHSLTSAVDAKDAYTCGHSERVALISRELAKVAGYPDALVERVYMAGLLHDVGKIGVPEAVLRKTGRLDNDEFEQIKKHPEIGAKILSDIKQVEDIIPGVMSHHERYDGKGYPHKLVGEAIPLFGRIICLADCFDAMTSSRTYRNALPLAHAMSEIRKCAGTQFDPVLAEKFLSIGEERLLELLRAHQEQAAKEQQTEALAAAEKSLTAAA